MRDITFSKSTILALRTEQGIKYSAALVESQSVVTCSCSGLPEVAEVPCHMLVTVQPPY